MNYIDLEQRGWQIGAPMVDRDTEWRDLADIGEEGETNFDKAKSVFKNFKIDSPQLLEKMFENDFRLTKIAKLVKDKDQLAKVKAALLENYEYIKNTYLYLSFDSHYPCINQQDYIYWTQCCAFLDKAHVQQAELDTQVIASTFKTDLSKRIECAKGEVLRFEFLEVVFRLAQLCYKHEIKDDSAAGSNSRSKKKKGGKLYLFQAISKLMKEHIMPSVVGVANTTEFKMEHLYTFKVNQYMERNEGTFKRIHSEYNIAGKSCMTPNDALHFVKQIGGLTFIADRIIMCMYGLSKQSTIDYLKTPTFPKELYFMEFYEFFAQIAHYTFSFKPEDKYDELQLFEHIDALLAHYCK